MDPGRDNRVRWAQGERAGHVESHFLKANAPNGSRAIWVKHTIFVPRGRPEDAVAEVWAIGFDRARNRNVAVKAQVPLQAAKLSERPFRLEAAGSTLETGVARGHAKSNAHYIGWALRFTTDGTPFHPFPFERMYETALPKSKALTPYPDVRFSGTFEVDGERWDLDDWPGMQGHNWGRQHADAYAWCHCNAWTDAPSGTWFEGLSARVKLGPVRTPWLSLAGLHVEGVTYRFDRMRAILSRPIEVGLYVWRCKLRSARASLRVHVEADRRAMAGLFYENPNGSMTHCLNSKLASGTIVLSRPGKSDLTLRSTTMALELGTKNVKHGVEMLV